MINRPNRARRAGLTRDRQSPSELPEWMVIAEFVAAMLWLVFANTIWAGWVSGGW